MFCKFLIFFFQKLAKYYNEIRTSPNAYGTMLHHRFVGMTKLTNKFNTVSLD